MIDERIDAADVRFCREQTCKAQIIFAETPSGRICPVDVEPTLVGEYVLVAWQVKAPGKSTGYLLGRAADAEPAEPRFTSHFRTCRKATQFSKKKGKA